MRRDEKGRGQRRDTVIMYVDWNSIGYDYLDKYAGVTYAYPNGNVAVSYCLSRRLFVLDRRFIFARARTQRL
jgi:hypothetical protein